jgi:hypothetical protein
MPSLCKRAHRLVEGDIVHALLLGDILDHRIQLSAATIELVLKGLCGVRILAYGRQGT